MRIFFITFLQFVFVTSNGQSITNTIDGKIEDRSRTQFAYLVRTDELFEKCRVINGQFSFTIAQILPDDSFKSAYLIISGDSTLTVSHLISKEKQKIWIPSSDVGTKTIVIEPMLLNIKNLKEVKTARIISGGKKTLLLDAQNAAIASGELEVFINGHPDVILSLKSIEHILKFYKISPQRAEQKFGNIRKMFGSLSDRLKQSELGKNIKHQIDEL